MIQDYTSPPSTVPSGSTVWAYLRDSGGPNQDRSVTQQREIIQAYCAKYGLVLSRTFEDIHQSGTKDERDEFRTMISLVEHGTKPQGIIVWSYARFARNELDANYYKSLLRRHGITIYSLIQDIPEGKYAAVMEALIHISDQEKAEQAAWESKRGLMHIVKQGAMPGRPPFGMKREPLAIQVEGGSIRNLHRWVPDPEIAPRVRLAFQMRMAGESVAAIHAETRLYGSLNSYTTFFTNKIYTGILEFGGETIENYCEAIVARDVFDAVQVISNDFADRKHVTTNKHPNRLSSRFLLSGLARCARCGNLLVGHSAPAKKSDQADYLSYRCSRKIRSRDCNLPSIPAKPLEQLFIESCLKELLHDPNYLASLHALANETTHTAPIGRKEKRQTLTAVLRKIRAQITNANNALVEVGPKKALVEKLATLEAERDKREQELQDLDTSPVYKVGEPTKADSLLAKVDLIFPLMELSMQQTILRAILSKIDVDRLENVLIMGVQIKDR